MNLLLFEQLLNGLQLGIVLFLMAAGLTLTFGIMNLVNLAHGSLFMTGAYLAVTFQLWTGSFLLAAIFGVLGTFVVGVILELLIIRHLYHRDHLDQVLCTVGLILFFNEATRMIWGPAPLQFPIPSALSGTVELIPGAPYPAYRLSIILVGLLVAVFLYILISKTRIGMLIRAGASNRTMTGILGVNIRLIYTIIFAVGSALAGLAGIMSGPILTVYPGMGDNILILTLVVLIIGGMGSVKGAFIAALLVGFIDTIGRAYLKDFIGLFMTPLQANVVAPAIASMLIYVLMALVLFFKPEGLMAPPGVKRAMAVSAVATHTFQQRAGIFAPLRIPLLILCTVTLLLMPWIAKIFNEPFWLDMLVRMMIFAIAALSLDLILGHTGLVSFGHALYLGLGAYVVGILAHHGINSAFIQWPLAVLVCLVVALPLGAIAIRTSGTFFIMITLAFAQMAYFVGSSLYEYGGDDGMSITTRSQFGGLIDLYDAAQFFFVVLAVLALVTLLQYRIIGSHFGNVLRGIRINEPRMEAIGYNVFGYKLVAFMISASVCGMAGVLLANATEFAGPQYMDWSRSGDMIVMVIFGGLGTLFGPIAGAFTYLGLERYLSALTIHWRLILGPILIAVVFLGRGGLSTLFAPAAKPNQFAPEPAQREAAA
jgi:branched-chain amino acid transport system permease protein